MASDTAPAAVPAPTDPPAHSASGTPAGPAQQAVGALTSLLAPVEPARTAQFTITPVTGDPTAADGAAAADVSGTSSAAFHTPTDTPEASDTSTSGAGKQKQQMGIARAWLLAGAERWRKGAEARLKRLDIQKAKASAFKESRQVRESVNRAEKFVGGNTNSGTSSKTAADKSSSAKTHSSPQGGKNGSGSRSNGSSGGGGGRGPAGPKNHATGHGGGHTGGRGGSSGSGPSGSSGAGRGGGRKNEPSPGSNTPANSSGGKAPAGSSGGKTPASGTGGGGSSAKPGPAGAPGPAGKDAPRSKDGDSKPTATPKAAPASGTAPGAAAKDAANGKDKTGPDARAGALDSAGEQKGARPRISLRKKDKPAPANTPGTAGDTGKDAPADRKGDQVDASKDTRDSKGAPTNGSKNTLGSKTDTADTSDTTPKPRGLDTQASREAGYRDGSRAARVTAHVEAWRDGVKDGWTDTREAAAADKHRLDQAHADRKAARTTPEKDKPVSGTPTSAHYHPPAATPIPVTGTTPTHIHLGAGAARTSMARGEVRTLKNFKDRFRTKSDAMTRVAEATKTLHAHAEHQAKEVTRLLEQAKGVKGGDKLIDALLKVEEAAKVQAGKAQEVHKRALRGAEACKTVLANVNTRYGDIYRAVVDSDTTAPADMTYYKD
ncbi:hypothetical protein [Streptomyces griseosporeus]